MQTLFFFPSGGQWGTMGHEKHTNAHQTGISGAKVTSWREKMLHTEDKMLAYTSKLLIVVQYLNLLHLMSWSRLNVRSTGSRLVVF